MFFRKIYRWNPVIDLEWLHSDKYYNPDSIIAAPEWKHRAVYYIIINWDNFPHLYKYIKKPSLEILHYAYKRTFHKDKKKFFRILKYLFLKK